MRSGQRRSRPRGAWGRTALALVALALPLALAACQTELYSGLGEEEANKMLVLLLAQDFSAAKVDQGKSGFALTVEKKQMAAALELLSANGHPQARHKSMGDVFSGQGMISTPVEEQARLSYALSQELSETFSRIDGVLTARVHVVLATRDQAGSISSPASAAVVIRHLPDSPVVNLTPKIKEVSSKSVPGLGESAVSVMLIPVRIDMVLPIEASAGGFLTRWRVLVLGLCFLAAFYLTLRHLSRRKIAKSPKDG
jgi:type III secretion protein J